jgi:segregation and condensation protein B
VQGKKLAGSDIPDSKGVIEAALFAAGKALSIGELSALSGLRQEQVRILADELVRDYQERESGMEIRSFEDRYVMQVRGGLAAQVRSVAPKELEAPLIRTLAIIAYKQPMKQSELAEIRGNKSYDHVHKLEELGLISATKKGRTKILTTTKGFADYFGLDSDHPDSVRHALLGKRRSIGVTRMYESLAIRMGLDYILVNPYKPDEGDLEKLAEIQILVAAPGYGDRIKQHYRGEILEAGVRTLSQLKGSAEKIYQACGEGDIEPLAAEIDTLLKQYRERARYARPVKPLTSMIADLARDLRIPIREEGITAAPDTAQLEAAVIVPAHQPYDLDILERIKQRCEALISGLI